MKLKVLLKLAPLRPFLLFGASVNFCCVKVELQSTSSKGKLLKYHIPSLTNMTLCNDFIYATAIGVPFVYFAVLLNAHFMRQSPQYSSAVCCGVRFLQTAFEDMHQRNHLGGCVMEEGGETKDNGDENEVEEEEEDENEVEEEEEENDESREDEGSEDGEIAENAETSSWWGSKPPQKDD